VRAFLAFAALLSFLRLPGTAAASPPASLSALDVIALEIGFTTIMARYYKPVDPALLLSGARSGIVGYLRHRGVANPAIPPASPHSDRFGAENAIARDVALAIARYPSRVRTTDLVNATLAGELAVLHDPYSVLFEPVAYRQFVAFLDGKPLAGIGAELDVDPQGGAVRIVDVFDGSPAAAAGLAPGDTIVSIDGKPPGSTPVEVGAALRGAAGTTVLLETVRDGAARAPVALVRRAIVPPDVTGRLLPGGIAYVRLRSFGAQSARELDAVLNGLRTKAAHAYVLDLRANGGGYRDDAIAVASHFVRGTVVTIAERTGAPAVFAAKTSTPLIDGPLAVLVDGNTASAAEIVAGAVQDDHAGTLIGTKTFGKGVVQETFPLPDGGAIKLTTARYRTPSGRDIEGTGITPDIIVAEPADAHPGEPGRDPQLDRALALPELRYSVPIPSTSPGGGNSRSNVSRVGAASGTASADERVSASANGSSSSSGRCSTSMTVPSCSAVAARTSQPCAPSSARVGSTSARAASPAATV
jgi:carboxyl-terminal processing protease